jgi:hypothetical protein
MIEVNLKLIFSSTVQYSTVQWIIIFNKLVENLSYLARYYLLI